MFVASRKTVGWIRFAIALACALAFAHAAAAKDAADIAPQLPAGVERVTSVEGITEYRLANGLKVLLFPDPSKPTITVNVTYLVGSRQESYGETGMAHLLEHLLFKGTPRYPVIDKDFNQRGMRSNGSTWLDRTNYFELFQASDDNLKWALDMEADRMVHSFIAKKDLDSEMTVVRNEYEKGENSPFDVLIKRTQSIAFDWHNYGNSTIGNRSDIEKVKIENLQAFYRRYYQPDNAVLLVAGKFDEAQTLDWVVQYFGAIPRPQRELPVLWTIEPAQDGERNFMVRRKGDLQIVLVAYKVPSGLHADANAIPFTDFILADTPSGRLHKALVETGKATQVFGYPLLGVDSGIQMFGAVVKKGEPVEPVRDQAVKIIESLTTTPPTREEIDRARTNLANEYERTLNNHESIGVQLSEFIALGDWRLFFESRDQLEKATPEQVAQVAGRYYRRDNRISGLFLPEDHPERAELPAVPSVAEVLKDFKPKAGATQAEAFDPTPANIDKRTHLSKLGDIKVALLPKKNRGEIVNLDLRFHYGDEKSLFGKRALASLTGQMLMRGSTRLTRTQIADEFDRLKVSGGVYGTSASFQTTRKNLADAIKLMAHVMREPLFPENEFEQLKKQTLTDLESQKSDPAARAGEALGAHFNIYPKGDWRHNPTLDETIGEVKAVTLEDVKKFQRAFYGASRGEISIVGDFDEQEITKTLPEAFAGWKSPQPYKRIESEYRDIAAINRSIETPDKENGMFFARINLDLRDDDPDYPALYLANYIIGGGADLNSRLAERIRQKEGLSYGVGSQLSAGSIDRAGWWRIYAIAAPQNLAKVETAVHEEVGRVLKEGFSAEEVTTAKSGALQKLLQSRAQDRNLAGAWAGNLFVERTFAWQQDFENRLAALKPEDLVAVLRKHIDPAKITVVKAADFSKAGKAAK
jgi:zinc protease